jgi:hypothetical protein
MREVLNFMLYIAASDCAWRLLPSPADTSRQAMHQAHDRGQSPPHCLQAWLSQPRAEVMIGFAPDKIAFAGFVQRVFDVSDTNTVHRIRRQPKKG